MNGVLFVVVFGDGGNGIDYLVVLLYVLSVGGMLIVIDVSGVYVGEMVWVGSGGG